MLHLIERIVARPWAFGSIGSSPWVEARLSDGSRVHAIVPRCPFPGVQIERRAPKLAVVGMRRPRSG
jgi:Flp pilus assembly CpaF family ATPase